MSAQKKILVTGSSGLIGSEVVRYFCNLGYEVYGLDNNLRELFFGPQGSTLSTLAGLKEKFDNKISVSACSKLYAENSFSD